MATYAVGDIQGCYEPLCRLLEKLQFSSDRDTLWVVGDLVNRGPDSLATLRYLKNLGDSCIAILGNHDLHLLAVASGIRTRKSSDTLSEVLEAPDCEELLDWLRCRPFMHRDPERKVTMVHAGLPPIWTLNKAMKRARKLEQALQGEDYHKTLKKLFKPDKPITWSPDLGPWKKLRLTSNYFTRMRFCDEQGRLDLANKTSRPGPGFAPWFTFPESPWYDETIIFGHWAALEGKTGLKHIHALDTGCVWGRELTAINLDTFKRTSVHCQPSF